MRHPQCLLNAHPIVMHEIECQRVHVVLELLRKSVRQPSEPPHAHAHGEVLALHVRRADMLRIGLALDPILLNASAFCGAIAALRSLG